jgi:hypothetical protein
VCRFAWPIEREHGTTMSRRIEIDRAEVEFTAVRSQGAGGQNVNKVSSAAHLRQAASSLPPDVKDKLYTCRDLRRSTSPRWPVCKWLGKCPHAVQGAAQRHGTRWTKTARAAKCPARRLEHAGGRRG